MERANTFGRVGYGTDSPLLSNVCWIDYVFKLQLAEWFQIKRNRSAPRNHSWRNHGGSPCWPLASTGLQPRARFVGDFSQGNAMTSVDRVTSLSLEDLIAGTLLLVTCLPFPAVGCIPDCTLAKPLNHMKGCLSPREEHVRSYGGMSHPHQESRLKKSP